MILYDYIEQDFFVTFGNDLVISGIFADGDGVPIDITGYTITFAAKKLKTDTVNSIDEVTGSIPDGTNGHWQIIVPRTNLQLIAIENENVGEELATHFYGVDFTDTDNILKTRLKGALTFTWKQ